jgi:hypothetical protein
MGFKDMEALKTIGNITLAISIIIGCLWMNTRIRLVNVEHIYGYKYKKKK